jgi:predicted nucleotidyltransferase
MNKQELMGKIKDFLRTREEIRFAYLFGSFVEEEHFKDIDVGIYIDETESITQDKFYDIGLSNELESIVTFPVDIIILNRAPSAIVYNASKGMLLKNTDDDLRVNFITQQWKLYWDLKPVLVYHMEERKHGSK